MALKYGLARTVDIYNIETQEGGQIIASTGDYLQAHLWLNKNLKSEDEEMRDILQAYAWAYFAAKRNGDIDRFGLPQKLEKKDDLFDMANVCTVYLEPIQEGTLPLANSTTQQNQ